MTAGDPPNYSLPPFSSQSGEFPTQFVMPFTTLSGVLLEGSIVAVGIRGQGAFTLKLVHVPRASWEFFEFLLTSGRTKLYNPREVEWIQEASPKESEAWRILFKREHDPDTH